MYKGWIDSVSGSWYCLWFLTVTKSWLTPDLSTVSSQNLSCKKIMWKCVHLFITWTLSLGRIVWGLLNYSPFIYECHSLSEKVKSETALAEVYPSVQYFNFLLQQVRWDQIHSIKPLIWRIQTLLTVINVLTLMVSQNKIHYIHEPWEDRK